MSLFSFRKRVTAKKSINSPVETLVVSADSSKSSLIAIQIELAAQPNQRAKGNEAWLLEVLDENNQVISDWEQYDVKPPLELRKLEEEKEANLLLQGSAQLDLSLPHDAKLKFLSHPWSGIVKITCEQKAKCFDLYSAAGSTRMIKVSDFLSSIKGDSFHFDKDEIKWLRSIEKSRPEIISVLHPEWRGVRSAVENLVPSKLLLPDDLNEVSAERKARLLSVSGCENLFIGGFPLTYEFLVTSLKQLNPEIKIFGFWLSSFLQSNEDYAWHSFQTLHRLCRVGMIDKIGFAKKGMAETIAKTGIKTGFIASYVRNVPDSPSISDPGGPHIGIWALAPIWRKNPYGMIAAASMIDGAKLFMVGQDPRAFELAEFLQVKVTNNSEPIPQDEMPESLARMDINLYVTLSECSPMLPLESLSAGVPCLLGPTSHLFEDHPYLHSRLVVPYPDRSEIIAQMLEVALQERDKIIAEYKEYALRYNIYAQNSLEDFLTND